MRTDKVEIFKQQWGYAKDGEDKYYIRVVNKDG